MSLTVPETAKHPCATCEDGLANKPGGICGQCFMDGKIAPADDEAFVDPLEPEESSPNGKADRLEEELEEALVCRAKGCDRPATMNVGARGRYATLCQDHYAAERARPTAGKSHAKRAKDARARQPASRTRPAERPAAAGIVAAAERLEEAKRAYDEAVSAMTLARQEFVDARDALIELAAVELEEAA